MASSYMSSGGAAAKPLPSLAQHGSGEDRSSSSEEEDDDDDEFVARYNEKVQDFFAEVVVAVGKAAPPILRRVLETWDTTWLEQYEGGPIGFTVQLGYGEDVYLFDGDENRFSMCPSRVETSLYNAFLGDSFPEAVHAWHGDMGDGGRLLWKLLQNMRVRMGVVVREGREIEIRPPVVTFTSEHEFARDCMDDDERDERDARRAERRRLKTEIQRKRKRDDGEEAE